MNIRLPHRLTGQVSLLIGTVFIVSIASHFLLAQTQTPVALFANFGLKKWPNDIATPEQVATIVNLTEQGLKEGGLGIGLVPGYAPGSGYKELLAEHILAAKFKVPTYSHVRSGASLRT